MRALIGYSVVAAFAALILVRFFGALPAVAERDRSGACLVLSPEPLDVPAVPFSLTDMNGKSRTLADFRGKVVLLNFWATWCPPCLEEIPSMEKLARHFRGQPFELLAVSVDNSWKEVRELFGQKGTSMTVLLDTSKEIPKRYGTEKFPESYLIDANGTARLRFVNLRDWSSAEAQACIASFLDG